MPCADKICWSAVARRELIAIRSAPGTRRSTSRDAAVDIGLRQATEFMAASLSLCNFGSFANDLLDRHNVLFHPRSLNAS
jgi:hypothetical protein